MKSYYRVLIIIAVVLAMAGIYISSIASPVEMVNLQSTIKMDSLSGVLDINKDRYILMNGKAKQQLAMIPPAAMDSLNFHPQKADTLTVKGLTNRGILVVYDAWYKGQYYSFRDSAGKPTWKGAATWSSNPKTCIGCKLCYNNCPADAITMVNVKGAYKAQIDQTKCTGCNTCITGNTAKFAGCPVKAITK